ncbi:MAG: YeeE/YedE family protein [Victivallales bacterium]|nr:YeeE/YedE family protein [Victivallales bacterium]
MKIFSGKWSFYLSAAFLALIINIALYLFDSPVGMSEGYLSISEYCGEIIEQKSIASAPVIDWQTGFLLGIFGGALITALICGEWKLSLLPENSGSDSLKAFALSVLKGLGGGFLVMLGLQLGGDSMFGQWASAMQTSVGAWIFLIAFFVTGTILSILLSRRSAEGGG